MTVVEIAPMSERCLLARVAVIDQQEHLSPLMARVPDARPLTVIKPHGISRMSVRVFVTGGTFDKEYDERTGKLYFEETHIPEMLRLGRCDVEVDVETLMMVDSLDMTDAQRQQVVDACRTCAERCIVITHGTDTMVETARAIAGGVTGKTVVLTGAMVPYAFGSSDGLFNLGSALSFVQALPPGVYIAMNGRSFTWDNVRKNREEGVFERLRE